MNKSGVSDVVATVLIIVLTIIAISILWVGVIPLVKNNLGVGDICSKVDVSISTSQGYTCYQPNGITSVQVAKGSEDLNISGLKFYLLSNGNSVSYIKDIALGKNTFTSFFLNSSGISSVDKIQVVPVVKSGNAVKDCSATYISSVSTCGSAGFSAAEIAQVINASNGTTGGSSGTGGTSGTLCTVSSYTPDLTTFCGTKTVTENPCGTTVSKTGTLCPDNCNLSTNLCNVVVQDNTYPQFSNYQDNNATLVGHGTGLFNVTVTNTNGTVGLKMDGSDVSVSSLGNGVYSASSVFSSNGTHYYYWYAYGSGTSNNYNDSLNSPFGPPYVPRNYLVYTAGYSLSFSGSNSYFTINNQLGISNDAQPYSFSFWIKPNSITSSTQQMIFWNGMISSGYPQMGMTIPAGTGTLMMIVGKFGAYQRFATTPSILSLGNWFHVVGIYNGTATADGFKIYVNGNDMPLVPYYENSFSSMTPYDSWTIGQGQGQGYYAGFLDDLSIFNRTLSAAEVSQLYNTGNGLHMDKLVSPYNSGLVAGYNFDQVSGSTIYDITGRHDATLTNVNPYQPGKVAA